MDIYFYFRTNLILFSSLISDLYPLKCNECVNMLCSIKRVTKLAVAKVSYPSRIPAKSFRTCI